LTQQLFCWAMASFSSFLVLYIVGRILWTGDQPVARPLPQFLYISASGAIRTHDPKIRTGAQSSCFRLASSSSERMNPFLQYTRQLYMFEHPITLDHSVSTWWENADTNGANGCWIFPTPLYDRIWLEIWTFSYQYYDLPECDIMLFCRWRILSEKYITSIFSISILSHAVLLSWWTRQLVTVYQTTRCHGT
jgi:hypothetical protein